MLSDLLSIRRVRAALLTGLAVFAAARASAQTVVLNEVSNGPSGNAEYMELAVIADAPVDPCTPVVPCLDLRGWMFDDNNGSHGANGVASGSGRFSTNALWACVPVGTVILIYNGGDPNPSVPPVDVSTSDGNCSIVVDADDLTYFEYTSTTPAVNCADPGGWGSDGSPTWLNDCALANPGDCARLSDPSGCEVFSLCYGSANGGSTIYFAGNGQRRVYYFNDGDPTLTANWTYGCAGAPQCGGDDQTPGAPNNALNAAYLAQFNPGCASPTAPDPLAVSAVATEACGCSGSAEASATGSVPDYTYVWYDAAWAAIGQNTATATGLCPGTYHVIGTSSVGCSDTATVDLSTLPGPSVILDSDPAACGSASGQACADASGGSGTLSLVWNDPAAQTTPCATGLIPGDYTVIVTDDAGCTGTGTVTVADSVPDVSLTFTSDAATCGDATGGACATIVGGGNATWDFAWNDAAAQTTACAEGLVPGDYTVTVTDQLGCTASGTVTVGNVVPVLTEGTIVQVSCAGASDGSITLNLPDPDHTLDWTGPNGFTASTATINGLGPGTYDYTWAGNTPCAITGSVDITEPLAIGLAATTTSATCAGVCDGGISLTITNGVPGFMCTVDGISVPITDPITACPGDRLVEITDSHGCTASITVTVGDGPPGPNADISPLGPLCVEAPAEAIEAVDNSGNWSGAGIADPSSGLFDPALAGPGEHWVFHRISGACGDADSILIRVDAVPIAAFTTEPTAPSELNTSVQLVNTSSGATDFSWTVDGLPLATTMNATMPVVPGQLNYTICLIASGLPACADTACDLLTLTTPLRVYVPNSFTPDGDGINDFFFPAFSGTPPVECTLNIFDRWGQPAFTANDLGSAIWSGEANGSPAPVDVYIWRLAYRGAITGDQQVLVGHVTLLR